MIQPYLNFSCVDDYIPINYSYSRSSSASRISNSGFIEYLNSNIIPIEYNKDGEPLGLNIEENRENLFTTPRDLTNTTFFTPSNTTITTSSLFKNLFGITSLTKLSETATTGNHSIGGILSVDNASNYCFSFSIHAAERGKIELKLDNYAVGFDLGNTSTFANTLSLTQIEDSKTLIIECFDNWYQCFVCIPTTSTTCTWELYLNNESTYNYTGITGYGCYLDCFQMEKGSVPTSYIDSTFTSQQRTSGILSLTYESNVQNSFYMEFYKNFLDTSGCSILSFSDTTSANDLKVSLDTNGKIYSSIVNASTETAINTVATISYTTINKFVLTFQNYNYCFYLNGSKIGELTSIGLPSLSLIKLGSNILSSSYLNDKIKRFSIFNRTLSEIDARRLTI